MFKTFYIIGAIPENQCKGAGRKFEFYESFSGSSKKNFSSSEYVFMDAFDCRSAAANDQYHDLCILRELDKIRSGLMDCSDGATNLLPLSTGAWGCGVFGVSCNVLHIIFLQFVLLRKG